MVRLNFLSRKQYNEDYEEGTLCSGTIFHENYILTAAHCCRNRYLVHVHFNDHSRSVEDKKESKITIMNSQEWLSHCCPVLSSDFGPLTRPPCRWP